MIPCLGHGRWIVTAACLRSDLTRLVPQHGMVDGALKLPPPHQTCKSNRTAQPLPPRLPLPPRIESAAAAIDGFPNPHKRFCLDLRPRGGAPGLALRDYIHSLDDPSAQSLPVPTTLTIDLRRDRGGINDQFLFGPAGLANAAMDTFFVIPLMRHVSGTKAAEVWFAQALVYRGAVRSIVRGPWRFTDLIRTPPPEQAAYYSQPVIPACCPWLHARQHFEWRQLPNGTLCQC
jgi:hypothetical protein